MADNRPRPRPRPKPKPKNPVVAPTSSQASSSATEISPVVVVDDDEDSFFLKNQSRTSKDWRNLNQIAKRKSGNFLSHSCSLYVVC
jgi:hypothetical protein